MTISSQPIVRTYACNGSTTSFPFPYRFLENTDLLVQRLTASGETAAMRYGSDYTVAGAGEDAGGSVTTTLTYPDGFVRIWLKMQNVQLNTYADNGPFPAQSHEDALDRLTLLSAMRAEEFSRTIHAGFGDVGQTLPPPDERAGKLWACDADGVLQFVAGISNQPVVAPLDAAQVYFDTNINAEPRLLLDLDGAGGTVIADVANPGGLGAARLACQMSSEVGDNSGGQIWVSTVYRPWTSADKPTQRRSNYAMGVSCVSQRSGALWTTDPRGVIPDEDWTPTVYGQEVGPMSLQAVLDNGVTNGKGEGLVCFSKEAPQVDKFGVDHGSPGQGKLVAAQLGVVKYTAGPAPDDRFQLTDDESGDPDADLVPGDNGVPVGEPQGGFGLRINAAGFRRSWAAALVSGRTGFYNGFTVNKAKHIGSTWTDPDTGLTVSADKDGIDGQAGVRGGRAFWYENGFAVYCKTGCDGWITVGHDGIPVSDTPGNLGAACAPIDVRDTGTACLAFNTLQVVGARQAAIHDALTDSQKITALVATLRAHGLIDPATS